jgi:hypothetical protein
MTLESVKTVILRHLDEVTFDVKTSILSNTQKRLDYITYLVNRYPDTSKQIDAAKEYDEFKSYN